MAQRQEGRAESGSIDPFSVDNPESYIVQIGRSVTFDHLRRGQARASGKHFPISEIGEAETLRADVARQDDELASKQELTQAMRAINAMPPLMKEVFIRHRFRDMTYKEIAAELDVSTAAVGRQVALISGQALFDVAKDPSRPFVVSADNRSVVAVGTAFDVINKCNIGSGFESGNAGG